MRLSEASKTLPLDTKFKGTRKLSNEDKQYLTQYLKKKKKKSVCYWVFPSKHNSDRQAGVPQGGCDCPSLVGLEQAGGRLETVTLIPSTHPTNILFKT